jgi:hypothetical protein
MGTSCRICPLRPQRGRCHFADSLSGQIVGKAELGTKPLLTTGLPVIQEFVRSIHTSRLALRLVGINLKWQAAPSLPNNPPYKKRVSS